MTRTKHRNWMSLVACLFLSLVCASCNEKATVTCHLGTNISADFGPTQYGDTTIGYVNTHRFQPGDIIELIPPTAPSTTGTGSSVSFVKYNKDTDFKPDTAPGDMSTVVSSDFEITGDAKVKAVEVDIKSQLQKSTQIVVTNGSRHSFATPLILLTRPENKDASDRIMSHPDRLYVFVTGVINADKIDLEYKDKSDISGSVNVVKIAGKFNVDVTYNCSDVTSITAVAGKPQPAVAFFFTTVQVNKDGKIDTVATADLSKYSLSNSLEAR